ncbi:MAG: DUF4286 family protein [Bacteroidales bacterium]|nr:DUF4286 family protein [Bacteroidales bacterium]MBD5386709.1 DUF4286 family protein [bacterium]
MIIHNATFMVRKEMEAEVILWLKGEIAGLMNDELAGMGEGTNPRVSAMREAGGVSHEHADAASVAFQVEFPSLHAAKIWSERSFNKLADAFGEKFGPEGMVFTSLFEVV